MPILSADFQMELLNSSRTYPLNVLIDIIVLTHSHTRKACGCGQPSSIYKSKHYTKGLPRQLLRHNKNKIVLNSLLLVTLLTHYFADAIALISMSREVEYNSTEVSEKDLHIGLTEEEADTKIIVHIKYCLLNGCRNSSVKTVHTDLITLLLVHLKLAERFKRLMMFVQELNLSSSLNVFLHFY